MRKVFGSAVETPKNLLLISILLFSAWIICVFNSRTDFQNAARIDPLAMVHTIFPWFWALLIVFALVCIGANHFSLESKLLHISLLCELSLFLYFTPFLLSGFSWSPDSLWHGGVASYTPEILSGSNLIYSTYVKSYPLSFMTTYFVEQVSGFDVFQYTLYVYPSFCIILITILAYTFSLRLLGSKRAFIAILVALPSLHFIEPHVSPFASGTVLVLLSFVLLTLRGRVPKALNYLVILVLTLTHPISPISLGIFFFVAILVRKFSKKFGRTDSLIDTSGFSLDFLFLSLVWFLWTMYHSMAIYKTVEYAIADIFTLKFLDRLLYVSEWTAGGQAFIFSTIQQLNLEIYAVFLIFISVVLVRNLGKVFFGQQSAVDYELGQDVFLGLSSLAYAAFGYVLFLATNQRFLLGRGLIFYIIIGSMCLSMFFVRQRFRKGSLREVILIIFFLLLMMSFPIISYSKEAYNTFTPSSGYGLSFVVSHIDLSNESISMGNDQQLAAFANLTKGVLMEKYPPLINSTDADFIVLRINSFFVRAMRIDLSFEDNGYTRLQRELTQNADYNKIYCSPTFKVHYLNKN